MKQIGIATFLIAVLLTTTRFTLKVQAQGPQRTRNFIVVFHDDERDVDGVAAEHARLYGAAVSQRYHSALKGYAATIPLGRRVRAQCLEFAVEWLVLPDDRIQRRTLWLMQLERSMEAFFEPNCAALWCTPHPQGVARRT